MKNFKTQLVLALSMALLASPSYAEAFDISTYFAEINLAGVATAIAALALLIIGICMSEKGIAVAKRVITKL
ncbi:phage coat protein [Vibrio ostreicida]|uniref:phage coat protein n=1 Tax=Vibrio ostreicida TaxID=526588 RepID=UPI003B5A4F3F